MLYDPDTKNFLIFLKKVLQNTKTYDIISKSRETRVLTGQKKKVATVAQSVERRIGKAYIKGTITLSSSEKKIYMQGIFLLSKIPGTKPGKIPIGSRHSN